MKSLLLLTIASAAVAIAGCSSDGSERENIDSVPTYSGEVQASAGFEGSLAVLDGCLVLVNDAGLTALVVAPEGTSSLSGESLAVDGSVYALGEVYMFGGREGIDADRDSLRDGFAACLAVTDDRVWLLRGQ